MEDGLHVMIDLRSDSIHITGPNEGVEQVERIFADYESLRKSGVALQNGELKGMLKLVIADPAVSLKSLVDSGKQRSAGVKRMVQPRSPNQRKYVESIEQCDMTFGIGPAGTGKTYLAVAMAVSALMAKKVSRIILVRPAVEAGERLGFLPGSLQEKVDPYLRPLYDALYDLLDQDKVDKLLERNVIEVAPLAFMRGRTLSDAFIIMDEAQNTTNEQMKMFVTRMGNGSKVVITGDLTQIDLPNPKRSGLRRYECSMVWREFSSATSKMSTLSVIIWFSGLCVRTPATAVLSSRCRLNPAIRRFRPRRFRVLRTLQYRSRNSAAENGKALGRRRSSSIRERMITLEAPRGLNTGTSPWLQLGLSASGLGRFLCAAQRAVELEGEVQVLLADDATLKRLNRTFRGKNKATDVLSFPVGATTVFFREPNGPVLAGDLAISLETAARQATQYGHSLRDEVRVLLLHGVLHLAGFDHEADSGEMAAREAELRRKLGLATSLIARVSGPAKGKDKQRRNAGILRSAQNDKQNALGHARGQNDKHREDARRRVRA